MSPDKRLLYQIAYRYYELEHTQQQIAESLQMSRSQVSRALRQAREDGIVALRVIDPDLGHEDLEGDLRARFGLKDAVVVSGGREPAPFFIENLANAAARYVVSHLKEHAVLGLSWGATLREFAGALTFLRPAPLEITVVPMLGSLGQVTPDLQINELGVRVARALGGSNVFLHAPSFVDTPQARQAIISDSTIRNVVDLWRQISLAVVGIGTFRPPSTLLERGGFPDFELADLVKKKAVGDICMRFFDIDGAPVDAGLDGRIIGVTLAELKRITPVVAVAGGLNKAQAILGALRTGVIDVLVTDDGTAREVIELG